MAIKREIEAEKCAACEGRGITPVRLSTGRILAREREEAHVPRVSRKSGHGLAEQLGVGETMVLKIEQGKDVRITWSLIARVRAAIAAAVEARANTPAITCVCGKEFPEKAGLRTHERTCVMLRRG